MWTLLKKEAALGGAEVLHKGPGRRCAQTGEIQDAIAIAPSVNSNADANANGRLLSYTEEKLFSPCRALQGQLEVEVEVEGATCKGPLEVELEAWAN